MDADCHSTQLTVVSIQMHDTPMVVVVGLQASAGWTSCKRMCAVMQRRWRRMSCSRLGVALVRVV